MNIGFISTRIAGTDGVSLEIAKLAAILRRLGHRVLLLRRRVGRVAAPGLLVPEMHFTHPEARVDPRPLLRHDRRRSPGLH